MRAISTGELARLRSTQETALPDTCTIQTRTQSVDALGGITHSYANTYTGVACRLDVADQGSETVRNSAVQAESGWVLTLPHNQAISVTDRVIHGGLTYEVSAVGASRSWLTARRVQLVRVDNG